MAVAQFHTQFRDLINRLGGTPEFHGPPNEISDAIPHTRMAGVEVYADVIDVTARRRETHAPSPGGSSRLSPVAYGRRRGEARFGSVPRSVEGGTSISGFCRSRIKLRGPGSVPP
jgi:hypothetical protein